VIISVDSLLMMLYWAIGKGGVLSDPVLFNLVCFYSYDLKMAPPSLIKAEIERAKTLGLIEVDSKTSRVSFTEKGLTVLKEHEITMASFANPKYKTINELEHRMRSMTDKLLAQQIQLKIDKIRLTMGNEFMYWRGPPEWGLGWRLNTDTIQQAEEKKKEIMVGDDLKITKAPPKPRKLG
jgi:hypothetical protein